MQETTPEKQKALSVYQILLGFLIVDTTLQAKEESFVIDFIVSNFGMLSKEDMSLQNQLKIISEDPDNFAKNAVFLNMTLSDEEKIDVFMYISDIMFADNEFSDEEYELYNKLMDAWGIESIEDLK